MCVCVYVCVCVCVCVREKECESDIESECCRESKAPNLQTFMPPPLTKSKPGNNS